MPKQNFKAVYFPDYKTQSPNTKGFVMAFSSKNLDLFGTVARLSSYEIRELLNAHSFSHLESRAEKERLPINTYCLWYLRKNLPSSSYNNFPDAKIDPIHTTFRGGTKNPLHNWYSFLEGYSPEFVDHILNNYAPHASIVYDPFAGTGVTPLVASKRGMVSYYSEVNPLLQFLVQTKINALSIIGKKRARLIDTLIEIRGSIAELLVNAEKNTELESAYAQTFGKSQFFDEKTFDDVLRARTVIDELSYSNQLVSDIVLVSILNSLLAASRLKRAGDIRYKTEKELLSQQDFKILIDKNLSNIIDDLYKLEPLPTTPTLISENAKLLSNVPSMGIDAVITSPPYLNGTNYFRNTKIELWFLRGIKTANDLFNFRQATVTAGINDVSQKKALTYTLPSIQNIVEDLEKNAYDQRIPKMVTDYFQDIHRIFSNLKKHLNDDATLAIDIGDSLYSGVHVPTDELFVDVLRDIGYDFRESVTLRRRLSRDGSVLKQVLLIFKEQQQPNEFHNSQTNDYWKQPWKQFKQDLPHTQRPFSKRNWGHPLHSLCSYQGKMKPSLAHYLVKTFTKTGDTMLDPFAGVGTIPFEASLNGVKSYGFEISQAALSIARAKLGKTEENEILQLINDLENYIKSNRLDKDVLKTAENFGMNKKLSEYYEPKTLKEIVLAREFFKQNPPSTPSDNLVFSSLLHILHGNRPYALSRRSHGITPFAPTGDYEYKSLIKHLKTKALKSLTVGLPESYVEGEMLYQDATSWWPRHVDNLDAIITSPPFFDSTRFYLANWLRLWLSGWDAEDFSQRPLGFVDEKQKNSFAIYEPILRQARERLKPGGVLVFHLGKSKKCDMAEKLVRLSKRWFKAEDVFEEDVTNGESHGIRDKGTVVKHQFLVLS